MWPDNILSPACRYDNPEIALNCGSMLRDCIRSQRVTECASNHLARARPMYVPQPSAMNIQRCILRRRLALHSDLVFRLMTKTEVQNFEIASDAFSTFKVPHTASSRSLLCTLGFCQPEPTNVGMKLSWLWCAGPAHEAYCPGRSVP